MSIHDCGSAAARTELQAARRVVARSIHDGGGGDRIAACRRGRQRAGQTGQIPGDHRELHRLPHAGTFPRQVHWTVLSGWPDRPLMAFRLWSAGRGATIASEDEVFAPAILLRIVFGIWLRGQDLNLRPSGYEPDELPGCSTPRHDELSGASPDFLFAGPRRLCLLRFRRGLLHPALLYYSRKGRLGDPFCSAWAVEFVLRRLFYQSCVLQTWQRPTLPRLKTKYHGRRGVSRPCSERERVQPPRHNHQVGKAQLCCFEKLDLERIGNNE